MVVRVLEIANGLSLAHGGPPRNAAELHAALDRRKDVRSHLISAKGDGANVALLLGEEAAQRLVRGPAGPSNPAVRLARLLLTCDVVIVHGYYVWWSPIVTTIARLLGKTVLVVPHGSLTRRQRRFSTSRKLAWELLPGRLVRWSAAAFVVGSDTEAEELHEVFPRLEAPVSSIGTEIPASPMPIPPGAGDGRSAPVRLLSMSRIAPKKRIDLMIDAVAELRRRGVLAHLDVAGEGDARLEQELRERAARLGVESEVEFTGMVAGHAKEASYAAAQVLLAPSDDENFGISVAEALARGIPCITSDAVGSAAGLPETAGRVIHAPTAETIADAVVALLAMDQQPLRTHAREFAEARFDWDAVADRWAAIIRRQHGR